MKRIVFIILLLATGAFAASRSQTVTPTTEQSFGRSESLGVSKDFARRDHTHGTPANPVDAHVLSSNPHTQYLMGTAFRSYTSSGRLQKSVFTNYTSTDRLPTATFTSYTSIGRVPDYTTVNGHALTGNVTVSKSDVGLGNVTNDAQVKLSTLQALGTGILKNTTTTGALSIAVAGDYPTLNQNTTGSAAKINGVAGDATSISWIAPTLTNSWVNAGGALAVAGYMKDALGIVHLKGYIKDGTNATAALTLPAGYRPSETRTFIVYGYNGANNPAIASIAAAGTVTISMSAAGSATQASLDGISFIPN